MKYLMVMTACPDRKTASSICRAAVEQKMAACCQILPGVESIYRWKGAVEKNIEFLCLMKTTESKFTRLKRLVEKLHPYEVPEITAVPISGMNRDYEKWMNEVLANPEKP